MEVVYIEQRAFESMIDQIERLTQRADKMAEQLSSSKLSRWLDNQAVCQTLNISYRTLQDYRDKGMIAFSRVNNKIYYKKMDVEEFVNNHKK